MKQHREWLEGRTQAVGNGFVLVPCKCAHLTEGGACGIESEKPEFCRTMEVGGQDCRRVVKMLRPELAQEWGW